jgi:formamidopyrimidine-DNA glycosylase
MPELPDITIYLECLERRVLGVKLEGIRLANPFVLRTVEPKLPHMFGRTVTGLRRIGKRVVLELEGSFFLVLHLMVAGRLHWKAPGAKIPGRIGHAAFDFATGTLLLTEAGTKKRASLHCIKGMDGLGKIDPGGIEILSVGTDEFGDQLRKENHTLKRALTDPGLFSGIGNSYSDEILHHAGLSPLKQTHKMDNEEIARLHASIHIIMQLWIDRLRKETGVGFPEKVTAFREGMAVHGRYKKPCPVCRTSVQRIAYAENECNYCPRCQTGGKLLADRAFSRLLKDDWPRTIQELEEQMARS